MIRIDIFRDAAGAIAGFAVNGHAGTAPYGQDIVCAAVAALTQTAVLGLERYLGRDFDLDIGSGKLILKLKGASDDLAGAILETMLLGLAEIAKQSPQSVHITEHRR
jgi:Predicted ribosomal protein